MSRERTNSKNYNNNFKKKRNIEFEVNEIDPIVLKGLSDTYIHLVQKPCSNCPNGRYVCKVCSSHIIGFEKAVKHSNDISHKNNFKRTCTRDMMKYLPRPTKFQLEAVDNCLKSTLIKDIFIPETESDRRKKIVSDMNDLVSADGCKLLLCGSLITGLSMIKVSDVNLFLDLSASIDKGVSYLSELKKISVEISSKLNVKADIKLDKADCGLFCKDDQGVLYHISDSTRMCKLTSELLLVYMKIDERADKLIRIFRYFANQAFIDRSRDGLLPVQVLSLLVIFYLQQLTIPVLPNLHKLAYIKATLPDNAMTSVTVNDTVVQYVSDITTIRSLWKPPNNNSTLSELWIGLLRFYSIEFDSLLYMVSIRCSEPVLKIDRNISNKRLAVEDPFDGMKNLLFGCNLREAEDFFNDQLQGCYVYFAVPQLPTGPAFTSVKFTEITKQTMTKTCLVTPTFTKDNYDISVDLMETEFKSLYKTYNDSYDITKWPASSFIKTCLSSILTSVFDKRLEIDMLLLLRDFKSNSEFAITNYTSFREYAMQLAMLVFREFSDYFEKSNSWNQSDINTKDALDVIMKAVNKFTTESLNITMPECNDDEQEIIAEEEFDVNDEGNNDSEEMIEDLERLLECDDNVKLYINNNTAPKNVKSTDSWKLPISFQSIYMIKNGILESSNDNGVYNEHRVNGLALEQFEYSFQKMPIQKKKLEIICALCRKKDHRKEYCHDAVPKFDALKFALRDVKEEWLNKLDAILLNKYCSTIPPAERIKKYSQIFNDLKSIITFVYPEARPQLFGSSNNGFLTRTSDIDICLEYYKDELRTRLSNKEIGIILKKIATEIRLSFTSITVQLILSAKVPIIKFFLRDNIHGDISVNNILGLENSRMLKLYSDLCAEMKILGNLIKYMSKSCEIGDASQGTLSSYAYIILLVHYLQRRGLLPVLQEMYEGDIRPSNIVDHWDAWYQSDIDIINKLWQRKTNVPPLAYLWLDFFYYYAVEFNIEREVVTIKQSAPLFKIDKGWHMSYLSIEDPFNLSHNLSASLSVFNFRYILQCFAHVLKVHSNNNNLSRKENTYNLLMEPSTLRPTNDDIKDFLRRERESKETPRNTTKSGSNQQELPKLEPPFLFKSSTVADLVYIETDRSDNALNSAIPVVTFGAGVEDFSIVPIIIGIGDKSIVIPMAVAKDDKIIEKLNDLFENGRSVTHSLNLAATGKTSATNQKSVQTNTSVDYSLKKSNSQSEMENNRRQHNENSRSSIDSVDALKMVSHNISANSNKRQQENYKQSNHIQQPNMIRYYATNPHFNMAPRNQAPLGYRFPQQIRYSGTNERLSQDEREYYDYERMPPNRQSANNARYNNNNRY